MMNVIFIFRCEADDYRAV